MKLLIASLLLATVSPTAATAAPDAAEPTELASNKAASGERLALARQFVALGSPADRMMDDFKTGMLYGAAAQLEAIGDEVERNEIEGQLDQLMTRLEPKLTELMPRILESYAQVYASEFSELELQQLVAFAQTPTGEHYLAKVDLLELDPTLIKANDELSDGILPIMDEFRKESCAKRAAQRLAAGDTKAKCPLTEEADIRSS